ncbi:MAG: hypothetical protein NT081_07220 [Actinobacteria bacterium]|nr:hypothetical protein [Actinomycetota bacterium]
MIGAVLLFLAGLSATFGVASFWTERAILDQDTWVATSKAIVNNPAVQQDVASALATQIVDFVGVDDLVAGVLPGPLSGFSGTVTDKVTELVALATVQVVQTDAFISVWESAVRATHDEFVHAVDGNDRFVSINSQGLSLDLGTSLAEIRKQLDSNGIHVFDKVNFQGISLQLPLVDAPGLERLQTWVHALRVGAIAFPAFAVIGAIAGLLLARRRVFAVIAGAIGALLGAGIVALLASSGRDQAIDHIAGGVLGVASATVIVDQVLSGLDEALLLTSALAVVVLVVGLVAAILTSRNTNANRADVASPSA